MGKVVRHEACPRCRKRGKDKRGDNLAVYGDGSVHCFSCGYHPLPKGHFPPLRVKEQHGSENKSLLPYDFSRDVPAAAWRWLLQWGLPYTYWLPYVGWSEKYSRLIVTVGEPVRYSIGRYIPGVVGESGVQESTGRNDLGRTSGGVQTVLEGGLHQGEVRSLHLQAGEKTRLPMQRPPAKWRLWGDPSTYTAVLGRGSLGPVVLVEDIISAHKVAQVATCIPLFGTKVLDGVLKELIALKRPVALWLDSDQYTLLAPKINRIQTFLTHSVRYISTEKDPKRYSLDEIKEILK